MCASGWSGGPRTTSRTSAPTRGGMATRLGCCGPPSPERSCEQTPAAMTPRTAFVTAAILLRDQVRQGEWPERLSYDSTEQRSEPAQLPATPPGGRQSPTRSGFGLGTLAERARRAQWPVDAMRGPELRPGPGRRRSRPGVGRSAEPRLGGAYGWTDRQLVPRGAESKGEARQAGATVRPRPSLRRQDFCQW
jgi:hypothetical protein